MSEFVDQLHLLNNSSYLSQKTHLLAYLIQSRTASEFKQRSCQSNSQKFQSNRLVYVWSECQRTVIVTVIIPKLLENDY